MRTYSFIIPHKNNPDLLNRCVNSIPQREDIQVIVVDDASDENKKPKLDRDDVLLLSLDKENSNGAGKARNVGLASADGKWVVFADADDFFADGFISILDEYVNENIDAVYYNAESVFSDTLAPTKRVDIMRRRFEEFDGTYQSEKNIRFGFHYPWNKMVKRDFIIKWNISFEEVPKGNDTFYSYCVGYFASKIKIDKRVVYVYTFTRNSLTTQQKDASKWLCDLKNYYKQKTFLSFVGCQHLGLSFPRYMLRQLKNGGFKSSLAGLKVLVFNFSLIKAQSRNYVESVCNR